MRSVSSRPGHGALWLAGVIPLALLAAAPIRPLSPQSFLWTAPAILLAAMMIAWAAESAQFFIAQGFALAILAWLQTMPEFAVEAVLAWKQNVPLLLANLTGALRLLTGVGWPMIYLTAAMFHRARYKKPLREIALEEAHCVEITGLLPCMGYAAVVWWKASLNLWDAALLIAIYVAYLLVLRRMPPEAAESIEDLELIPRSIVTARKHVRTAVIAGLFAGGGLLIYFMAEPFLASLLALSTALGISNFVFVQWVAPFVSEFPEKVSAFYWARTIDRASMALMNMISSNINQWTLLAAMLPIVFSASAGAASTIHFDARQEIEILMTLGQQLLGTLFLINMTLRWWEAAALFLLWLVQFALGSVHWSITFIYFAWSAVEVVLLLAGKRKPAALQCFAAMWKRHLRAAAIK
jgi:cation:H+ antiporter